jgi:hypothetical protein
MSEPKFTNLDKKETSAEFIYQVLRGIDGIFMSRDIYSGGAKLSKQYLEILDKEMISNLIKDLTKFRRDTEEKKKSAELSLKAREHPASVLAKCFVQIDKTISILAQEYFSRS